MRSLRTSRQLEGSVVSFRGLCLLERRAAPFSLLDVVNTDGVLQFSGHASAGDVDCSWQLTLWHNGFWSAHADFHDGGVLAGDFFFIELVVDPALALGVRLEGSLLSLVESRHLSVSKAGSDPKIRENWHRFEASGPSVRMHAAPGLATLLAVPFVAFAAAPFVVVAVGAIVVVGVSVVVNLAAGRRLQPRRCPDEPIDSQTACVEFVFVDGPGPPQPGSGDQPPDLNGPNP